MAVVDIKKFNDPVLRKRARKIGKIDEYIKKLAVDMVQTMKNGQGIGLAGPQVGVSKRIITVEADYAGQGILVLINPKIIKKSRQRIMDTEGCLSFPGIYIEVKRAKEVTVKAKDIKGKKIVIKADGLLARTLQHEIDHLNGYLFFDRLSILKKIKFKINNPSLRV